MKKKELINIKKYKHWSDFKYDMSVFNDAVAFELEKFKKNNPEVKCIVLAGESEKRKKNIIVGAVVSLDELIPYDEYENVVVTLENSDIKMYFYNNNICNVVKMYFVDKKILKKAGLLEEYSKYGIHSVKIDLYDYVYKNCDNVKINPEYIAI